MEVKSVPRPDLAAHERSTRGAFRDVVSALRELLGAQLVAYIGSVKETRAVNEWAEGQRSPSEETQVRLRLALQVALMIEEVDGAEVARSWFSGLNPQLGDRSPARLVREGDLDEVGAEVVQAARAFVVSG